MDEPFKRIATNLVGLLPWSKTGHRYILTIMDYGARYPEAVPLKCTDSKRIADALITVFSRIGVPEELLTDCGTNLTGKLMAHVCDYFEIS